MRRQPTGTVVVVTVSRRNLLTLLHKLELPGSARMLPTTDCWLDGEPTEPGEWLLVLHCEDGQQHYAGRESGPGAVHPHTEQLVAAHAGAIADGPIAPGRGRDEDNGEKEI